MIVAHISVHFETHVKFRQPAEAMCAEALLSCLVRFGSAGIPFSTRRVPLSDFPHRVAWDVAVTVISHIIRSSSLG